MSSTGTRRYGGSLLDREPRRRRGRRRERRKRVRTQGGGKEEGGMWGESKDETVGSGKKEVTGGERCREERKEKRDQEGCGRWEEMNREMERRERA